MASQRLTSVKNFFSPTVLYHFLVTLKKQYTLKFLLMMTSHYAGIEGSMKAFLDYNETIFYKSAGYPVQANQQGAALSKLPMAIKGLAGLASDLFPILGYEKSTYMTLATMLGTLSMLMLIVLPIHVDTHPFYVPALFFFLCNCQVYFGDLLIQGKFTELMKKYPESRGNIIAFGFIVLNIGGMLPAASVGALADALPSPRYTFILALPFSFQPLIFLFTGCMINDRADPLRNNRFDVKKFKKQLPVMIVTIIITTFALGSSLLGLFTSNMITFSYSVITLILAIISTFIGLPVVVAKVSLYVCLGHALYLQLQPTLDYFLLGDEECVPGGPHFSFTYLKTYIGIVTQIGRFISVWIYQAILTKTTYRSIFWISSTLRCGAAIFDLMIVNRWNIALGIPDRYFYLVGHAVIYEITIMLENMPFTLMIGKMCPQNIEVTIFALLAGLANYGAAISILGGGFLANLFGISTTQGECNFDHLNWVIFIGNFCVPFILIILAFYFIPNRRIGENIADETWENSKYLIPSIKYYKVTA